MRPSFSGQLLPTRKKKKVLGYLFGFWFLLFALVCKYNSVMVAAHSLPPFPYAGECASLIAAMIWAVTTCVFRGRGTGHHPQDLNLFKTFVALFFMGLSLFFVQTEWPSQKGALSLAVSAVLGIVIGDTALFASLSRLGAPIAASIQCLSPALAGLFAYFWLSEELSLREMSGMGITVCAVIGAVLFARPFLKFAGPHPQRDFAWGIFYGVLGAVANAAGIVLIREEIQSVDILSATFIRTMTAFLFLAATIPSRQRWKEFATLLKTPLPLAGAAFAGTFLGLLLMSAGAKYTKAGITTALTNSYPIFIVPLAAYLLGERIGWKSVLSIVAAVCGVILMLN